MKRLLYDLIGHMGAVVVAGVDVVHANGNRLAQNRNRSVEVAWRAKNLRAGKLHRAVAHPVQAEYGAWERERATKFYLFHHCVFPFFESVFVNFLKHWYCVFRFLMHRRERAQMRFMHSYNDELCSRRIFGVPT